MDVLKRDQEELRELIPSDHAAIQRLERYFAWIEAKRV